MRIEVDALRAIVIQVDWTNQNEHRSLLRLSAQLAAGFLQSGFAPVLLIDTFSGDKVGSFLDAFLSERPQSRVFVAVLYATDEVLRQRLLTRDGEAFRDITIAMRINAEGALEAKPFETLINSSSLQSIEVVHAILVTMRMGHFVKVPQHRAAASGCAGRTASGAEREVALPLKLYKRTDVTWRRRATR